MLTMQLKSTESKGKRRLGWLAGFARDHHGGRALIHVPDLETRQIGRQIGGHLGLVTSGASRAQLK
jgi:hypothetical protein